MKKTQKNKSTIKNIEKLAFKNIYEVNSEEKLTRFLKVWWCKYYKRPSKDPLFCQYTFEELLLEYFEQNLINNDKRFDEIAEDWLINSQGMDDEEWYEKQERELQEKIESGDLEFNDKF